MSISKNPYPLVSLAIPVFNGANYLRFAIDSALAQTYPNIEILVVNDGSSDGGETEKIALSYENRVRYFCKENGGVGSALNLALKESHGEYFCWLSHDDEYLPDKIARQVEFLFTLPKTGCVVFCRHSIMDERGAFLTDLPPPPQFDPSAAAYQLLLHQWLHCCTILAPLELFVEAGGFREDLPTTQDYDLLVKIALNYPFFEIPEVLLRSRSHSEQGSLTLGHQQEIESFFEEHIPLLSPEYMHRQFTPAESVEAFVKLGIQMQKRSLDASVMVVCRQLIQCEEGRVEPMVLVNAIARIANINIATGSEENKEGPILGGESLTPQVGAVKKIGRLLTPPIIWNAFRYFKRRHTEVFSRKDVGGELNVHPAKLDFLEIYEQNKFDGTESRSGGGSTLYQTRKIRQRIPMLLRELGVQRVLDVPCGDWNWMQYVDLSMVTYVGGDIVDAIVELNRQRYGKSNVSFDHLDIITGSLPQSDLIICRDCLVHLSFADGLEALRQFRMSGAKWLLTTTFVEREKNDDLYQGQIWRTLNLEMAPFNFPKADCYINEGCTEGEGAFGDKCLALWRLDRLERVSAC